MSRIGKKPIALPKGVEAKVSQNFLVVKGPKGELNLKVHPHVSLEIENNEVKVKVKNPEVKKDGALWGLYGSLIKNMIVGVTDGFGKKLEINGIGYKAQVSGEKLILNVGFSHPVEFVIPKDIAVAVDKNIISINGQDKQLVGETAARIRAIRPPEPYKGKGIKYVDEVIRRKAGKAAKAAGAGAGA